MVSYDQVIHNNNNNNKFIYYIIKIQVNVVYSVASKVILYKIIS